jgi:anaerobic glycerol-3-phosphate dehydrogenase
LFAAGAFQNDYEKIFETCGGGLSFPISSIVEDPDN